MFDSDLFIGIERRNIDVKNPLPTKYPLSLLVRVKDNSKFLCADSPADRLLITAAVILSQVINNNTCTQCMELPIKDPLCKGHNRNNLSTKDTFRVPNAHFPILLIHFEPLKSRHPLYKG